MFHVKCSMKTKHQCGSLRSLQSFTSSAMRYLDYYHLIAQHFFGFLFYYLQVDSMLVHPAHTHCHEYVCTVSVNKLNQDIRLLRKRAEVLFSQNDKQKCLESKGKMPIQQKTASLSISLSLSSTMLHYLVTNLTSNFTWKTMRDLDVFQGSQILFCVCVNIGPFDLLLI